MAPPPIAKHEFLGAVTLLAFSADGSLLYVGVGPTVFLYATVSGEFLGQHELLTRGILHGCDVVALAGFNEGDSASNPTFVGAFFGQKRVACFQDLPQTPEAAQTLGELTQLGNPRLFCDWVFDVQLLSTDYASAESKTLLAAVGLAHNLVQIWDPVRNEITRSVQCAERCILYALAFHGRSLGDLVVASGTVFQQILLWNPMENGDDSVASDVLPVQRLHAHDGVLFKLAWSSDARLLASVSDDRTVQLWSNDGKPTTEQLASSQALSRSELLASEYSPAFRAWGHTARLWDVAFWAGGVATTSEDGLCKLWDLDGNCVATLQGHVGRHVWRAAVHPSQRLLATGGGDGAVKLWDLTRQLMSSSAAPGSSDWCQTVRIPVAEGATPSSTTVIKKKKGGSASHSVRNIVMSPLDGGETAFVASEHGEVFRLHLPSLSSHLFYTLPPSNDAGSQARSGSLSTFSIDSSGRFLLLGDLAGRVCVVETSTATLVCSWTTHVNVRVMKIWWDQGDALFTSSADGTLSEWNPVIVEAHEPSTSLTITMKLAATFQSPARCALSALVVTDRSETRNVLGGDGRGNVYVFQRQLHPVDDHDQVTAAQAPTVVLKGVHGREQVATLLLSKDEVVGPIHGQEAQNNDFMLFSGGHDGYICSFTLEEDTFGALVAKQIGRESIRGLSTIKQLWWSTPSTGGDSSQNDLIVFGFHATSAILHNFSAQYRLFSVECGGWRRPHTLFTAADDRSALPQHTFVFTPPVARKEQVEIKVHSTLLSKHGQASSSESSSVFAKCSLHDRHHGRMTTCVTFLGDDRIVTAAEDNSLMLHRRLFRGGNDKRRRPRWTSVASGTAHTTTVRALTAFRRPGDNGIEEHIVISGGGKQRLNVWQVRGDSDQLRHLCGHERVEATQDHRILGLATFALPASSDYWLVAACNSEGSIQLLLLDLDREQLLELGDCRSASRKPILSCVGFQEDTDAGVVAGLAVGSTDGLVTLWHLSALLEALTSLVHSEKDVELDREDLATLINGLQPSGSYLAHDMGVNCLALVLKKEEEGELNVTLISGGDDQSLFLREFRFPTCGLLSETRAVNASGSAIKAVACVNAQVVFAAGYDQRVSKWRLLHCNDCSEGEGTRLEWQGAAFSECADIADLAVRRAPAPEEPADDVVVVGQGLQMLQFQRE
ncbi:hypothetical protein BBJ28_00009489 [Nothophytophthora sp. Chile5]|nr:hypothetical protein BBJ28_00009489 [Nothophytophthora sp. Chile5]